MILSPPLQQNFIDRNTRFPALAKIYFFKAGTTTKKSVYQRSNDPANPYVVAPNPITLDASGSLPDDIFLYPFNEDDPTVRERYDIFVCEQYPHAEQENDDNQNVRLRGPEIFKRLNWAPVENVTTSNGNTSDDYVVNGQFNYPIVFWNPPHDEDGQIDNKETAVCFGWLYKGYV